ncbi:hypothetical protein CBR_g41117 [Chara braunii]|uniref:DNA mismatch repair protein n=1 Tax=Chara braunii TaxID=69332 RepID=A0A388LVH8_CHABU|nr:hypothetical protein CBR_g41117 [Chara braunii]|eukprot:GBG86212.1 hypothetical protein CBR_g41117 [Chara braunii]
MDDSLTQCKDVKEEEEENAKKGGASGIAARGGKQSTGNDDCSRQDQEKANDGDAQSTLIGRRLRVLWPRDRVWYTGHVSSFDRRSGKHCIAYDDGDEEALLLKDEKVEWLDAVTAAAGDGKKKLNGDGNVEGVNGRGFEGGSALGKSDKQEEGRKGERGGDSMESAEKRDPTREGGRRRVLKKAASGQSVAARRLVVESEDEEGEKDDGTRKGWEKVNGEEEKENAMDTKEEEEEKDNKMDDIPLVERRRPMGTMEKEMAMDMEGEKEMAMDMEGEKAKKREKGSAIDDMPLQERRRPLRSRRRVVYCSESGGSGSEDTGDEDWDVEKMKKEEGVGVNGNDEDDDEEEEEEEEEDTGQEDENEVDDLDKPLGRRRNGGGGGARGGAKDGSRGKKRGRTGAGGEEDDSDNVKSHRSRKKAKCGLAMAIASKRTEKMEEEDGANEGDKKNGSGSGSGQGQDDMVKERGGGSMKPKPSSSAVTATTRDRYRWLLGEDRAITTDTLSVSQSAISAPGTTRELVGEAAVRFGARAEKFEFLGRNRKDANRRCPDHPQFDPRTLFLPGDFLKGLPAGQKQWWEFKSKHMDKVLLFKMGKFYEMFEMDAHVGAQDLDLQYMKGDQPHCGFPEKNYAENAERLARKGHRVLVVEQTETPEQLAQRKERTGAKDKFTDDDCRTHLRSVLSELRPVEVIKPLGALSEETERAVRESTRQPLVNALMPETEFWSAERTLKELSTCYGPLQLENGQLNGDPDRGEGGRNDMDDTSSGSNNWPLILRHLASGRPRGEMALSALGGCLFYLRQALLDRDLLAMKYVRALPGSDMCWKQGSSEDGNETEERPATSSAKEKGLQRDDRMEVDGEDGTASASLERREQEEDEEEPYMVLDSAALENLEILENNRDGGTAGTLLAHLDHCVTSFGRRLLRRWLVRPLYKVSSIVRRQDAVSDLKTVASDAVAAARRHLQGIPDLERMLARLHASSGAAGGSGRFAQNVVLYEDSSKRHLGQFTSVLRGCRAMVRAIQEFKSCEKDISSSLLRHLVTPGMGFPDVRDTVNEFERAFDWAAAESSGRIIPRKGVDRDYDKASQSVEEVESRLDEYLERQRRKLGGCAEMCYVTVGKEPYQMEIPERLHSKVPNEYEVRSQKKGYRRYWTPAIRELLQEHAAAAEEREAALNGILRGLLQSFCSDTSKWVKAVAAIAELDALCSLASLNIYVEGTLCRPVFERQQLATWNTTASTADEEGDSAKGPWLYAKELRHPSLSGSQAVRSTPFVPNDTMLGGPGQAPFMLLTGPNMGGKSTLLRQVCLAVIMAQIGADVPAVEFGLSPTDRIFVRMGARDHIMSGQSTFLVELSETAGMLRCATQNSLVALDELGRGTATSDGAAIA